LRYWGHVPVLLLFIIFQIGSHAFAGLLVVCDTATSVSHIAEMTVHHQVWLTASLYMSPAAPQLGLRLW
jgi:hypothetical protein